MKKLRTLTMLQDFLDQDFSWRLKEIAVTKSTVRSAPAVLQKTVIRAALPLLYAHWEGFIKNASDAYVNFVNHQGVTYKNLTNCFILFGLKHKIQSLVATRKARPNLEVIEFLLTELGKRADLNMSSAVNTESNLNSLVFENIASSIGIDPTPYETRYKLIDESLLSRRNRIAHGEYLDVEGDDYRSSLMK